MLYNPVPPGLKRHGPSHVTVRVEVSDGTMNQQAWHEVLVIIIHLKCSGHHLTCNSKSVLDDLDAFSSSFSSSFVWSTVLKYDT